MIDAATIAGRLFEPALECAIEFGTLPDCDCPFEHWHVDGWCLDIHFEEDGTVHSHLEHCEVSEFDYVFRGHSTIDQVRNPVFLWASAIIFAQETDR